MNGTIDTTSAKQTFIGGVHDGINLQCRNILSDDFNAAHRLCLSHAASLTCREQIRPMSSHDSHSLALVRGVPRAGEALGFGSLTCTQLFRDADAGPARSVQKLIR